MLQRLLLVSLHSQVYIESVKHYYFFYSLVFCFPGEIPHQSQTLNPVKPILLQQEECTYTPWCLLPLLLPLHLPLPQRFPFALAVKAII